MKTWDYKSEHVKWSVRSSYILLPLVGWYAGSYWGALIGFGLAHVVDMYWPRWKGSLTWEEINRVIGNFYKHGTDHGRLIFWDARSGREFHLYRGPIFNFGVRLALEVPGRAWADVLTKENQDYLNQFGVTFWHTVRFRKYFYVVVPDIDQSKKAVSLLKEICELGRVDFKSDVLARCNAAKKNPWVGVV